MTTNIDAKGKDLKAVMAPMKEAVNKGDDVVVKNADEIHGLASGLRKGTVQVVGNTGDYTGGINIGATINIEGNAQKYLGDNMTKGRITVTGNVGYGAGIYCYGGTVIVKGNAGDFTSTMNKGATIIIGGNVGNEVGTYMTAGELIVLGNAGDNFGNYIIRGTIYLGGTAKSYGNNVKEDKMTKDELARIKKLLETEGFKFDASKLKKLVPKTDKPFYEHKKEICTEVTSCR